MHTIQHTIRYVVVDGKTIKDFSLYNGLINWHLLSNTVEAAIQNGI